MRSTPSQPQLNRLRRCRSLEWVHDADDDSDEKPCRMVIRVGENVAIFPLEERALATEDGSLPITSYWYGKVYQIYYNSKGDSQDAWLDIQWYYRRVDLEDENVE
ncbi:hypothetical protein AZE42_07316 [Rhizopogon vesiculosus]|uniref:BAH domain-containing protein n=1 Tax=Rhizopogon vesiculosus TaxID=180088 RepID=A0A1J8QHI7_9AGAM|nr:hypothetical protein AZE42_07316 [Rhizopogon vesiculosus]